MKNQTIPLRGNTITESNLQAERWDSSAGFSDDIIKYEAIDQQTLRGRSFYRLKQTDFDGQFEYSEIVSVENLSEFRNISIYPNPVTTGRLNIKFEGLEGEEMVIGVQDLLAGLYRYNP